MSLLLVVADRELLTHQVYSRLRDTTGEVGMRELYGLSSTASDEDWEHYHSALSCVERLASQAVDSAYKGSGVDATGPRDNSVTNLLWLLRTTEKQLVRSYREICRLTIEWDYRTFDMSFRNLNENAQHQQRVSDLLTGGWTEHRAQHGMLQAASR
ncbi:MAG: hypothetical protein AAF458_03510 [Pseudomonadota bacterium]